jgi:hypothetical protein
VASGEHRHDLAMALDIQEVELGALGFGQRYGTVSE